MSVTSVIRLLLPPAFPGAADACRGEGHRDAARRVGV